MHADSLGLTGLDTSGKNEETNSETITAWESIYPQRQEAEQEVLGKTNLPAFPK
jgi:hypothetical protein